MEISGIVLFVTVNIVFVRGQIENKGLQIIVEPPPVVEFSNKKGTRLDCIARGWPTPETHWISFPTGALPPQDINRIGSINSVAGLRWQLDNGSLIIAPFSETDLRSDIHMATYQCVASSSIGKILSRPIILIPIANYIEVIPSSEIVTVGNTAVLQCKIPSKLSGVITITSWLQDDSYNIYPTPEGDGKVHMLPSGELIIHRVDRNDNASTFQCRTTDKITGETKLSSRRSRIFVIESQGSSSPQFTEPASKIQVRQGDLVILQCYSSGNPPPQYRWELVEHRNKKYEENNIIIHGGILVIHQAQTKDSREYSCLSTNSAGSARKIITLIVTAPLMVTISPPVRVASLGQPTQFFCNPTGFPIKTIIWIKDGNQLSNRDKTLHISSVRRDDQGMYQCFVKNDNDIAQSSAELRMGDTPPQFLYKFIQQTLQPGPHVSLKCVASGNPTPSITWSIDGFDLPENERFVVGQYAQPHGDVISHLNITFVKVQDGGNYECKAENRAGSIFHSAKLNIYGSPYIRPMGKVSAVSGENIYISCPVAGYPIKSIKWFKGDRLLPTHRRQIVFENGTLLIEKLQSGHDRDGGEYHCTASDKMDRKASSSVNITVMVPPKITPFIFRLDLNLGDRVGVQCVVSKGDPPLSIMWTKDNTNLQTIIDSGILIRHLDDYTSVLSISELAPHHGGNYTCIASNSVAITRYSASLSVNVPPAITPFSFGELSVGERARVTCSIKRGDPPIHITWFKNTELLNFDSNLHDMRQDLREFSNILSIPKVEPKHSGNYTCKAQNQARTVSYTATLLVTVPPSWIVEPKNKVVLLEQPMILDCVANGFPEPKIIWKKASETSPGIYKDLSDLLLSNGTLYIEKIQNSDRGNYLCEASNGIGVGLSSVVHVTVNSPVKIKIKSSTVYVKKSDNTKLSCTATGDKPIHLKWNKFGDFLEISERISLENSTNMDEISSYLIIRNVITTDNGLYTCIGSNSHGHDESSVQLFVQDVPNSPGNVHIIELGSRRIVLSWSVSKNGNSPITRYIIKFRTIKGDIGSEVSVHGSKTIGTITDLTPATEYEINISAMNSVGISDNSSTIHVKTTDEAPSAPPLHVMADAISSTEIVVTWMPPPKLEWNGLIIGYYVGIRILRDNDLYLKQREYNYTTVTFNININKQEITLTNLGKYKKYGIVIQAYNNKGPGPLSAEIFMQTLEDVPEEAPRHLQCSTLSSESLQISWQPPTEKNVNGIIQGYRLFYKEVDSFEDALITKIKTTTSLTAVVQGLSKFTNYSIEVVAYTKIGDGLASNPVYCMTKEDVPGAPAEVKALLDSNNSILISWLPPKYKNGIILKYGIYVKTIDNDSYVQTIYHPQSTNTELFYLLKNIKHKAKYEFYVTAFTTIGEGQSTPVVTVIPINKVKAAIASFGRVQMAIWKSDVTLPCRVVGNPAPQVQWLIGQSQLQKNLRVTITNDNTLIIKNVQKKDQADYMCEVNNRHSKDKITYQLIVQVPPKAPLLLATGNFAHSIQLQWKSGDDGGSPIVGFILFMKSDQSDWSDIKIPAETNTYTLLNLLCGTMYYIYIIAYNKVGNGYPSQTIAVRTRGTIPKIPSVSELIQLNSTFITLFLHAWPDGGCPIASFNIEYTSLITNIDEYIVVNNIRADKAYPLMGLRPATQYRLRITPFNAAGSTKAIYQFTTLNLNGEIVMPNNIIRDTNSENNLNTEVNTLIIVLSILIIFMFLIGVLVLCVCMKKKDRTTDSPNTANPELHYTVNKDNKNNLARREQCYATVRNKTPSSSETLTCIPEYADDIRPYATFRMQDSNEEATKMQTFMYWERQTSLEKKPSVSDRCKDDNYRVKKRRQKVEEFDSYGSESDTEQGTSSRTESSHHLDNTTDYGSYHTHKKHHSASVNFHHRYYNPKLN